jgi:hypothetical protein
LFVTALAFTACHDNRPFAYARFEVIPEGGKDLKALQALMPKGDASITLNGPEPHTALYRIGAYDKDPATAAKRANEVAHQVQAAFEEARGAQKITIWQRAEVPSIAQR